MRDANTPERSSVERRRGGEREGAARWDADALVARSASGKEAVEKARKTSPVWEPGCLKKCEELNRSASRRVASEFTNSGETWHTENPTPGIAGCLLWLYT